MWRFIRVDFLIKSQPRILIFPPEWLKPNGIKFQESGGVR